MTSIKKLETSVCGCICDTSGCEQCNEYFGMPGLLEIDKNNNGCNNNDEYQTEIEETWTMRNGFKISNSIPLNWEWIEYNSNRGPSHCETCRTDGMFEGVFYGLCSKCCAISDPCSCVYCRVAKKDGHKRIERRTNICNFIKTIQSVVDESRRDYPTDEYGIVQENIETGFYVLDLHTTQQYEQIMIDGAHPSEVNQLSIGELSWRLNPKMEIPVSVCEAALKAAERTDIMEWVKELWGVDIQQFKTCDNCSTSMLINSGDMCDACMEAYMHEYDIQCKECGNWVLAKETDVRNYCLDCQNPEYDPVWPMGD